MNTILVTGATGNIGGEVARQLVSARLSSPVLIRALVRNIAKADQLRKLNIDFVQGDLTDSQSLHHALEGVDKVFLTVPESPDQFEMMKNFLVAATQVGHPYLVMLSGAEASNDSPRIISRWHWQMQEQIIASGLPYTFLQLVYIMQNVLEYFEVIHQTGKFYGPIVGDLPFSMVSPQDIASSAIAVLTQPGHEGKTYILTGAETLSMNAIAQAYQTMLHREVAYVSVPRENAIAQLVGRGQADWFAEAIISMLPPSNLITNTVFELTGQPPVTLAAYLQTQFGGTGQQDDTESATGLPISTKPRASLLVEPNSVIRLICYEPQPGVLDEQFISAWRVAVEPSAMNDGLVYRELVRQVPEWNALAAAEIQTPNPYTFIDYAILRPDASSAAFPTLPAEIATQYKQVDGTYHVAHRFVRLEAHTEPGMIFYNLFQINPPQVEQGFVLNWPNRADFQALQPGFFSAILHRRTEATMPINAFNRAEWLTAKDYANTIPVFDRFFPVQTRARGSDGPAAGPTPIRSMLGLFRLVVMIERNAADPQPTMKAVQFHRYGGPEVLQYEDVPQPVAGHGQIKIKVRAVSINGLDTKMRAGDVRLIHPAWFPDILGFDLAGTVVAVGEGVTAFAIGDDVFGNTTPFGRRGYAQYVSADASAFQRKPKNLDFVQAAVVPSVAFTATNALFTMAGLQAGQTILIHGGAGAVGTFAIQFAKQSGAHVITTASAANFDYVQSLGADQVIDYREQRFEDLVSGVDVVLDTQGGDTRARSWGLIRKGGTLVTLVAPPPNQVLAAKYGVRAMMNQNQPDSGEFFARLNTLIEQGHLRIPRISTVLPLSEAAAAHALLDQGKVQGRLVLEVQ